MSRADPSAPGETRRRCSWAGEDPLYCAYHDAEWGVPLHDDRRLFEMLILEGFQAGLAWITILRKRDAFRRAFRDWDVEAIARMGKADVKRLLADAAIVRNRAKIESALGNARAFLAVRDAFGSFDAYLWRFTDGATLRAPRRVRDWKDLPAETDLSRALARDLKGRGFRFVGPTVCYAYMQACGLVDDHEAGCWKAAEADRQGSA